MSAISSDSVVNHILTVPPQARHRLSVVRLNGTTTVALAELRAQSERLARGLRAAGIGRGDRIGILASNCLEWVLLDLAALRLGAGPAGFEPSTFDRAGALLPLCAGALCHQGLAERPAENQRHHQHVP